MTQPPLSLATTDGALRVEFRWREDRFEHVLFLDDQEVGCSIEGDSASAWPPSPPLQQLSLEPINESNVILGVGSAGTGHWSISVEADPQAPGALKFDVACRSKQLPDRLGSRYQLPPQLTIEPLSANLELDSPAQDGIATTRIAAPTAGTTQWIYRIAPTP